MFYVEFPLNFYLKLISEISFFSEFNSGSLTWREGGL